LAQRGVELEWARVMNLAVLEFLTLGLFALSGIAFSRLIGIRDVWLLVVSAVVTATSFRVGSFVVVVFLGLPVSSFFAWLLLASVMIVATIIVRGINREFLVASSVSLFLVLVSIALKFMVEIGERHHADSAMIMANAVLLFAEDQVPPVIRRGFSYPLLLALGRDGYILSSVTPFVFLTFVVLVTGWSWHLARGWVSLRVFVASFSALALLFASTPIVQVAVFYINSHVLLALAAGLVLAMGLNTSIPNPFRWEFVVLTSLAGIVGALSRAEGFIIMWFALLPMLQHPALSGWRERLLLCLFYLVPGVTFLAWVAAINPSELPLELGVALGALFAAVVVLAILLMPLFGAVRRFSAEAFGILAWSSVVVVSLFYLSPDRVRITLLAQLENVVGASGGEGGWGFLFPSLLSVFLLLSIGRRSKVYRTLLALTISSIALTLALKILDSGDTGFGRIGFWDTINRSWIHFLPLYVATATRGFVEAIHGSPSIESPEKPQTSLQPRIIGPM